MSPTVFPKLRSPEPAKTLLLFIITFLNIIILVYYCIFFNYYLGIIGFTTLSRSVFFDAFALFSYAYEDKRGCPAILRISGSNSCFLLQFLNLILVLFMQKTQEKEVHWARLCPAFLNFYSYCRIVFTRCEPFIRVSIP